MSRKTSATSKCITLPIMVDEIHFALLSDWPDSKIEIDAADTEILEYARAEIARLNARYPVGRRAALLHPAPPPALTTQRKAAWMGWERKRGKLHELNLLLRGDSDTTFLPLDVPLPEKVVHVMTLDADTRTTRDAVASLVGKLCHPLNRPHFDADQTRRHRRLHASCSRASPPR